MKNSYFSKRGRVSIINWLQSCLNYSTQSLVTKRSWIMKIALEQLILPSLHTIIIYFILYRDFNAKFKNHLYVIELISDTLSEDIFSSQELSSPVLVNKYSTKHSVSWFSIIRIKFIFYLLSTSDNKCILEKISSVVCENERLWNEIKHTYIWRASLACSALLVYTEYKIRINKTQM